MKSVILLFLIGGLPLFLFAQGLTKSSKGESAVLFRGNTINLDLGESELSIGVNNLQQKLGVSSGWVWGTYAKVKNESGIGSLFNKGDLVPAAQWNGFFGRTWSNGFPELFEKTYHKRLTKLKSAIDTGFDNLVEEYAQIIKNNTPLPKFKTLRASLELKLNSMTKPDAFVKDVGNMISPATPPVEEKVLKKIQEQCQKAFDRNKKKIDKVEERVAYIETEIEESRYWQVTPFAYFGTQAQEFKRFIGFNDADYSLSFKDTYFRGSKRGLGLNVQSGKLMFGITVGKLGTSNFALLKKNEYTLRTTKQNASGQTLVQEKKITAYANEYAELDVTEINADVIYRVPMSDMKAHALINPYLRVQTNSDNIELLPNSTNVGTGFYFFKNEGKFLGGFYIELPDVDNNYERLKPEEDQNFRPPLKRISFGIVTRFTISGALNTF